MEAAVMIENPTFDEIAIGATASITRTLTREDIELFALASRKANSAHHPRPLLITDAAINLEPDLEQKADIVRNAIDLAHVMGIESPRVAILAAVETVNPKMRSTLDAAALCKMADRGQIMGGVLDGPLALDNAIDAGAARQKGIRSGVAGKADILVVPDLEAGNMVAKQLTFLSRADAAGVVLGARVPIILTSRADSGRTRLASCALAALLARAAPKATPGVAGAF